MCLGIREAIKDTAQWHPLYLWIDLQDFVTKNYFLSLKIINKILRKKISFLKNAEVSICNFKQARRIQSQWTPSREEYFWVCTRCGARQCEPHLPPSWSSPAAWAVSPSDLLTTHWYMPRSSLVIPLSRKCSVCLPLPGIGRPSLYQVMKCAPAWGWMLTSQRNSALPPRWTLKSTGVTSTWSGAATTNLSESIEEKNLCD